MSNGFMINTPEGIEMYRLLALRGALQLEIVGMKRYGQSAYSMIKREFGLKGNKSKVLEQFTTIIDERKIK